MAVKRRGKKKAGKNDIVSFDIQKFFFDRPEIQRAIKRMQIDPYAYSKYAGYLRKVSIRSIRKVRGKKYGKAWRRPSPVNTPPRSRDEPQHRLRVILYGFDTREAGMVVGPVFFKRTSGTTVPSVHEKAKSILVKRVIAKRSKGRAVSKAQAQAYKRKARDPSFRKAHPEYFNSRTTTVRVKYKPRPFMWPAAKKTISRFPDLYARAVKLK